MKILGFDTSNNSCSVAISEGQAILSYSEDFTPSMQAQSLLTMIEQALQDCGLSYNDIDYLVTTSGPGSFTGIRIGLAAAVGIMLGSDIKCGSVSNFELAFYRARSQVKRWDRAIIVLDAYRNQLYVQIYDNTPSSPPLLLHYQQTIDIIEQSRGTTIVAGSGIKHVYSAINHRSNCIILPRFPRIKAIHICRYADELLQSGRSLDPLTPLYIRSPDAIQQK